MESLHAIIQVVELQTVFVGKVNENRNKKIVRPETAKIKLFE